MPTRRLQAFQLLSRTKQNRKRTERSASLHTTPQPANVRSSNTIASYACTPTRGYQSANDTYVISQLSLPGAFIISTNVSVDHIYDIPELISTKDRISILVLRIRHMNTNALHSLYPGSSYSLQPRSAHHHLPQELIQLIAQQCVEPYTVSVREEDLKPQACDGHSHKEHVYQFRPSRYCCKPSSDPRYLALVSRAFAYGIRQGLKHAFTGHFTISVSAFESYNEYSIVRLLATPKLDWLIRATTRLRVRHYSPSPLRITSAFRDLRSLEIHEERDELKHNPHDPSQPRLGQPPAAKTIHDGLYDIYMLVRSQSAALALLGRSSYFHWRHGSPMLGDTRITQLQRLKCIEGHVRVKVDITTSPAKIIEKSTMPVGIASASTAGIPSIA